MTLVPDCSVIGTKPYGLSAHRGEAAQIVGILDRQQLDETKVQRRED